MDSDPAIFPSYVGEMVSMLPRKARCVGSNPALGCDIFLFHHMYMCKYVCIYLYVLIDMYELAGPGSTSGL